MLGQEQLRQQFHADAGHIKKSTKSLLFFFLFCSLKSLHISAVIDFQIDVILQSFDTN